MESEEKSGPAAKRDLAIVLMVAMTTQAELMAALIGSGALAPEAARPLIDFMRLATEKKRHHCEDVWRLMSDTLARVEGLIPPLPQDR